MLERAKMVLQDCIHAHALLEDEINLTTFRVLWVSGVALAREVGHVLRKVDAEENDKIKKAVSDVYDSWKNNKDDNLIFWHFIENERNQILKQYKVGFFPGPVRLIVEKHKVPIGEYTVDDNLFCPIIDGPFAGEDCRDVLREAIDWWEKQLSSIEKMSNSSAS
jgi:hypothetical protein